MTLADPAPRQHTAAELVRHCLELFESGRTADMAGLFTDRGRWELAYPLDGVVGAAQTVIGRDRIARMFARERAAIEEITFHSLTTTEVRADLAFAEFASSARLVDGQPYSNRYICKVSVAGGKIDHWLEYFDPRPAERLRARMIDG